MTPAVLAPIPGITRLIVVAVPGGYHLRCPVCQSEATVQPGDGPITELSFTHFDPFCVESLDVHHAYEQFAYFTAETVH